MSKEYDVTNGMFSKDCKFDPDSLANLKRAFVHQKLVEAPPDIGEAFYRGIPAEVSVRRISQAPRPLCPDLKVQTLDRAARERRCCAASNFKP